MSESTTSPQSSTGSLADLPLPDEAALAHSETLTRLIRQTIADNGGSIGFDDYMRLALYAPGLGYYSAGASKFGAGGDFVTAPEISPLFSRCLARQCADVLREIAGGDIVEFGGGTGVMAAQILSGLDDFDCAPRRYLILDLSGELRARQHDTIAAQAPRLLGRVEWLDDLPPKGFRGVMLGNELIDAMPVKCFMSGEDGFMERRVACDVRGNLCWSAREADQMLSKRISVRLGDLCGTLAQGYCSEINIEIEGWLRALAERLHEAAVLLIDYGYPRTEFYHPQRVRGTLICHYRHRAHEDPFWYPGLQDISASVDFSALAGAARAVGMDLLGYTTQAHFLLANGLLEEAKPGREVKDALRLSQQVKRLTLPSEMGERFQVIGLGKGYARQLQGFSARDLRHRL